MTERNPKVDAALSKSDQWRDESQQLRGILLDFPQLTEQLKWNSPCYAYGKTNSIIISGFKNYVALGFFKGALLSDPEKLLHSPGENSQAMRQLRFTSSSEIASQEPSIRRYVDEAIALEEAGKEIDFRAKDELVYPDELTEKFASNPDLQTAFEALTPGRQRAYVLYFSDAKQSSTRSNRIEKYTPMILAGKGMLDR